MTIWKPLLIIIPVGLAVGFFGAIMVAPDDSRADAPGIERSQAFAPEYDPEPESAPYASQQDDEQALAAPDRGRPDLDWDEESWPRDYSRGAYAYDDGYFGDDEESGSGWIDYEDEARPSSSARPSSNRRSEAEEAAQAAERAARDAMRGAAAALPAPAAQARAPAPPDMPEPPAEPRAADGDLPAIW